MFSNQCSMSFGYSIGRGIILPEGRVSFDVKLLMQMSYGHMKTNFDLIIDNEAIILTVGFRQAVRTPKI